MIKENIIKLFYGIEIGTNLTTILLGHACVYVYICVRTRAHALFWYVKILDIFFLFCTNDTCSDQPCGKRKGK